jgi:hypothetical protein
MEIIKTLLGGAAAVSLIWFLVVAFYLILPILIWLDTRSIRKTTSDTADATEELLKEQKIQNALTRQLLKAYGHEPSA